MEVEVTVDPLPVKLYTLSRTRSPQVMRQYLLAAAALAVTGSCGNSGSSSSVPPVVVADSMGTTIVTTAEPITDLEWKVALEPKLSIGSVDGEGGAPILHGVRDVRRLTDDRILVSSGRSGSKELRILNSYGESLRSFGSEGQAPGEFGMAASMRIVRLTADSVVVADEHRLNVFSLDGVVGRTIRLRSHTGYGRTYVTGSLTDGSWIAFAPVGSGRVDGAVGERIDMEFGYLRFDSSGRFERQIAAAMGRPRITVGLPGGWRSADYVPLTPSPQFAIQDSTILLSATGDPEIRRISQTGDLLAIYRWRRTRTKVSAIWTRFTSAYLAGGSEDERASYEKFLAMSDLPVPNLVPAIESVLTDPKGFIWVERYRLPWENQRLFDILGSNGEWIGIVATPPGTAVREIGDDYILGVHRDELGVQTVVLHELVR